MKKTRPTLRKRRVKRWENESLIAIIWAVKPIKDPELFSYSN